MEWIYQESTYWSLLIYNIWFVLDSLITTLPGSHKPIYFCILLCALHSAYSFSLVIVIFSKLIHTNWIWFPFRHEHPIIPVIKEHRTLAKLLNCTLGSICSLARLSMRTQRYTLHGHWLQTSTATGRLSMEEPNLQVWFLLVIFIFFLTKVEFKY